MHHAVDGEVMSLVREDSEFRSRVSLSNKWMVAVTGSGLGIVLLGLVVGTESGSRLLDLGSLNVSQTVVLAFALVFTGLIFGMTRSHNRLGRFLQAAGAALGVVWFGIEALLGLRPHGLVLLGFGTALLGALAQRSLVSKADDIVGVDRPLATNAAGNQRPGFLVAALVWLATSVVAFPLVQPLSRFPRQDLFWNDLQVLGAWRWNSETLRDGGFLEWVWATIDFRQNLGVPVGASPKWPAPVLDPGFYAFLVTDEFRMSVFVRWGVLTWLAVIGLWLLVRRNRSIQKAPGWVASFLLGVFASSLILHPLFFHEVGLLNQWYLLLTPLWVFFLSASTTIRDRQPYVYWLGLLGLTGVTISTSDLFGLSYIFFIGIFSILRRTLRGEMQWKHLTPPSAALASAIVFKLPYFATSVLGGPIVSGAGSWDGSNYYANFLGPLINQALLLPVFVGPVTVFLNVVLLGLALWTLAASRPRDLRWRIGPWLITIGSSMLIGLVMHANPLTSEFLPSAVRYHLSFAAPLLISVLALDGEYSFSGFPRKASVSARGKSRIVSQGVSAVLSVGAMAIVLGGGYGLITPVESQRTHDGQVSMWLTSELPDCVNRAIGSTEIATGSRSILFATSGLLAPGEFNDAQTFLLEQPGKLDARTFGQWRYESSQLLDNLMRESFGVGALNARQFPLQALGLSQFAANTQSNILITDEVMPNLDAERIADCSPTFELPEELAGNPSLVSSSFIYKMPDTDNFSAQLVGVSASWVDFDVPCRSMKTSQEPTSTSSEAGSTQLPIAYWPSLTSETRGAMITGNSGGYAEVDLSGSTCRDDDTVRVRVSSKDPVQVLAWLWPVPFLVALGVEGRALRRKRAGQGGAQ